MTKKRQMYKFLQQSKETKYGWFGLLYGQMATMLFERAISNTQTHPLRLDYAVTVNNGKSLAIQKLELVFGMKKNLSTKGI